MEIYECQALVSGKPTFPGYLLNEGWDRGENPIGNWTIRVSDQGTAEHGLFLGWNMVFWGSTIDPSRAIKFELLPADEWLFPPIPVPKPVLPPASSTQHVKPTIPAPPPTATASSPPGHSTSTPTADQGWFPDMSSLITNQKWFFGAIGAVAFFGLGAGVFFWRRRLARMSAHSNYSAISGEEVPMAGFNGGGLAAGRSRTTRELYDAFGEVSDDDEYGDETTALRPRDDGRRANLGFHSGFLDDDEPSAPLTAPATAYRDEPEETPAPPARRDGAEDEEDDEDDEDEDEDDEDDEDDEEEESSEEQSDTDGLGPRQGSGNESSLSGSWQHATPS